MLAKWQIAYLEGTITEAMLESQVKKGHSTETLNQLLKIQDSLISTRSILKGWNMSRQSF